jgi:hypothetical protein
MTQIVMIIQNIWQKTNLKRPLGRWNIETCDKKLNIKIDLANEDHCGPCGKYVKNVLITEKIDVISKNKFFK